MFFAAAALPQQLWDRLTALAERHGSSMQITTSWGIDRDLAGRHLRALPDHALGCIGVPLPGVELALVPSGDKTELRVRGPNVTPGYHRRPDLAGTSFDERRLLRTGDAVAMIDEDDPAAGLVFAAGSPRTSSSPPAPSSASAPCVPACSRRPTVS